MKLFNLYPIELIKIENYYNLFEDIYKGYNIHIIYNFIYIPFLKLNNNYSNII